MGIQVNNFEGIPFDFHKASPRVDPATLPQNYLVADPARRPGYIDETSQFFDQIEANLAGDPQAHHAKVVAKNDELQAVLQSAEWDTLDPVFKSMLLEQLERGKKLQERLEVNHGIVTDRR